MKFTESRVRVRYAETDQMGIAHHASYVVWFEIGRTDLCRHVGLSYREIEERGFLLVVTEIACRYRTSFRYDDEVLIRTHIEEWGSRAVRFGYELYDATGSEQHARGYSAHFWLDRTTRRPVAVPEDIVSVFRPLLPAGGGTRRNRV